MRTRFVGYWGVVVSVLLAVGTVLGDVPAVWAAYPYPVRWMTIGSAGTVDEADTGIVQFDGPWASIKSTAPLPATLNIRYNVGVLPMQGETYRNFAVRYLDNGSGAQIIIRLYEFDETTGASTLKGTFDSNSFPASPNFQLQETSCGWWSPSSWHTGFWIEAEITKTTSSGNPRLASVAVKDCP